MASPLTFTQLNQLYLAYFGRPVDFGGYVYYTSNNATVSDVAAAFAASAESQALYGTGTVASQVNAIYQNLFNRPAELAGLQYWTSLIVSGAISAPQAAIQIMAGAQGTDLSCVNDKLTASAAFFNVIQADTTGADALGYSGSAAAASARAWLATVTSDATTIPSATATQTAVNNAVAAGSTANAVTATLTTGVDNLTATVFNGLLVAGTTSTLNSFDTLTGQQVGSSANNILNVNTDGTAVPLGLTLNNIQTVNINATADESVNLSAATSVKSLNITQVAGTPAAAGAVSVTAAGTTAISDTGIVLGTGLNGVTVNGGSTVAVSASGKDAGATAVLDNVTLSNATGAVTVTTSETLTGAGSTVGNVTVNNGTAVTVNATVNAGVAIAAAKAGTITVNGATGAVTVNNTTNVTDAAADVIVGSAVSVKGGTAVVVNNTVTASAAANATALASAQDGAVTVLDGGTAASVVVNNTVTAGVAAKAAVLASPAVPGASGGPGFSAGAGTPATAAAAAVPGVVAVTAPNAVIIAGASVGTALANSSNTINYASVTNYGAGSYINSSALQTLALGGAGAGFTVYNVGATPFTSLALNLNALTDTGVVTTGGVKTLNVTTGGSGASTLANLTDAALTTLNIAGTQTLALTAGPATITTIAVSGAAGLTADVSGLAAQLASFTTTSSGTITATLDDTTQTFVGSTGRDVITIANDATKTITGGSATNNELILSAAATTYTAAKTGTKVTGFTTLGVSDTTATDLNVYDMKNVFKGFNAIDVVAGPSGAGSSAFTNVASGTTLAIDASLPGTGGVTAVEGAVVGMSLLYQVADATGASDSMSLALGTSKTSGITVNGLMVEDANAVGIGTLNVVSNGKATFTNTITTLVDNGLSVLNVSGTEGLTIGTLNEATTQATAMTLNNTSAGALTITNLTDANLGSLTFSGTGTETVTNLLGVTGHILTISNTGSGTASIGTMAADLNLNSLTLNGNVALNADNPGGPGLPAAAAATGATNGVTVSGATDNSHINLNLKGAAAGSTDSITVGNGNNYLTDGSTLGTVNVTVGTGANYIDVHTGANNATYAANVTLGAHTSTAAVNDTTYVSVTGAQTAGYSTTITGAVTNDVIKFVDAAQSVLVTLTPAQQTAITGAATLAGAITLAFADTGVAHDVAAFTYGGDTYVIENVLGDTVFNAGSDSVVHLVGTHTIASVVNAANATVSVAS